MKICVLQSSYEGSNHLLQKVDHYVDLSRFSNSHTFKNHLVRKSTAKTDIDLAVSEGYEFYFNFMWGSYDDNVAGVEAVKYFESLGLPNIGLHPYYLRASKRDFYEAAKKAGKPSVPGTSRFPVFVKPAHGCAGMLIDEKSLCRDKKELDAAIRSLEARLGPRREERRRDSPNCGSFNNEDVQKYNLEELGVEVPGDIVVQEFIEGNDYSCTVLEIYDTPVPLTPVSYISPPNTPPERTIQDFNKKFNSGLKGKLLDKKTDPKLFAAVQRAAVQAFVTNGMHCAHWCNVDIRVSTRTQEPVVLEVNPMPGAFCPEGADDMFDDPAIEQGLPGGHRALINILISTYLLQQEDSKTIEREVANSYDWLAPTYEKSLVTHTNYPGILKKALDKYDFRGNVLDLGCGTGLWGRIYRQKMDPKDGKGHSVFTGVDFSPEMAKVCDQLGYYESIHIGSIQRLLPSMDPTDHIVSSGVLLHMCPEDLSLVLSCCFRLARTSVTLAIDEITDIYNENLKILEYSHMFSRDHVREVEEFGEPRGWKLVDRWREFGFKSMATGDDIFTTVFRFEKEV